MEKKKKSGCWISVVIALIGGAVIAVLAVVGVFRWFMLSTDRESVVRETAAVAATGMLNYEDGRLVIDESDWSDLKPLKPGQEVSIERYLAATADPLATDLAKSSFQLTAEGAPVSWVLKLQDVREENSGIIGSFELPYVIESGGGTSFSSTIVVRGFFSEESRDALLALRRGEWVRVGGGLSVESDETRILEAKVLGEDPR